MSGFGDDLLLTPAPPPLRLEAETFTLLSGFFTRTNGWASAGSSLRADGAVNEQRASTVFNGPSGLYNLDLGYFDENDGVSRLGIFVNGIAVDAFLWDQQLGASTAVGATLTKRSIFGVHLQAGATIEFRGFANANERLDVDFLDVIAATTGPSAAAPMNAAPIAASTLVGVPLAFSGSRAVSVSDADGGRLTTTLRVTNGSLAVGASAAAVVVTDGGATVTVSGAQAAVNTALAGLTFTPTAGFAGQATVTIATTDGVHTDTDAIDVSVAVAGDPDARISAISRDPGYFDDRLHFNHIDFPTLNSSVTRTFKSTAEVEVANTGTASLVISGYEIDGPFVLANPAQLTNVTLALGARITVQVAFDRTRHTPTINNENGVFSGQLRILSNDQSTAVKTINLSGFWQDRPEGGWEANVNEVWEVFGFGNRIENLPFRDSPASPFNTGGLFAQTDETEVLSPYWRIADGFESARITQIARFSGVGSETVAIHRPFSRSQTALSMSELASDTQTILPRPSSASSSVVGPGGLINPRFNSITFTRETIPDGWQGDDVFGVVVRGFSTDPSLNTIGEAPAVPDPTAVYGHWLRMFQAVDANGVAIPNVYLGLQDLQGLNYDYNDHMLLFVGIAPVSRAPVLTRPAAATVAEDGSLAFTGTAAITVSDPDGTALTNRMTTFVQAENGVLSVAQTANVTISGNGTKFLTIEAQTVSGAGNNAQSLMNRALASLVYTPDPNFAGTDSLRIVTNDRALEDREAISITVTPVNDAPTAQNVSAATLVGAAVTIAPAVQDVDNALSDLLISAARTSAQGGTVLVNSNDTLTYTPATDFFGVDSFTYAATDPAGLSSPTRTVTVEVSRPEFRVEAETFQLVQFFEVANRVYASGGQMIEARTGSPGIARYVFDGPNGVYDLAVGYHDENDGVARMEVWVGGREVADWLWDQNLGASSPSAQTLTERTITDLTLRQGDVVELRGFGVSAEIARTDYIDFIRNRLIVDPPPASFRVEAEAFQLVQNYEVANRAYASGGQMIESRTGTPGIARYVFNGPAGVYDLDVGYHDENDGVARMEVWVGGREVADWLWNQDLGASSPSAQTLTERTIADLTLRQGDVIELRGFRVSAEIARTDYVDFNFVDFLSI